MPIRRDQNSHALPITAAAGGQRACIGCAAAIAVRYLLRRRHAARPALAAAPADEPQNPVAQDAPIYALAAALQAGAARRAEQGVALRLLSRTGDGDGLPLVERAPSLAPPEAEPLTMKQAALAPVLASISLFSLYALIKYLSIDPSLGYRLLTSAFAGGASSLVLYEAADAVSSEDAPSSAVSLRSFW